MSIHETTVTKPSGLKIALGHTLNMTGAITLVSASGTYSYNKTWGIVKPTDGGMPEPVEVTEDNVEELVLDFKEHLNEAPNDTLKDEAKALLNEHLPAPEGKEWRPALVKTS